MPWCDSCSHFFSPNALTKEGECPKCGITLKVKTNARKKKKIPWHVWVLIIVFGGYLIFRLIQGIVRLVG